MKNYKIEFVFENGQKKIANETYTEAELKFLRISIGKGFYFNGDLIGCSNAKHVLTNPLKVVGFNKTEI